MLAWWTELLPVFIFRWLAKKEAIMGNTHFKESYYYITAREDIIIKVKREFITRYEINKDIDRILDMNKIDKENDTLIDKLP